MNEKRKLFDLQKEQTKEKIIKDLTDLNIGNMWKREIDGCINIWVDKFNLGQQKDYSVMDKIFDIMKQDTDIVEITIQIHHRDIRTGLGFYSSTESLRMIENTKYDKVKELIKLKIDCSIADLDSLLITLNFMHHHVNPYID